jgi:hypothetical protein
MQPSNQNDLEANIAMRFRTLLMLWGALFLSIGIYFILSLLTNGPNGDTSQNRTLTFMLAAAASFLAIISLAIKQKFLTQSVERQRVELVQTGYTIAWALSEAAALLGLLDHFVTGNRYYYLLFIIGACGMLLNFPRRQHVEDACYKRPTLQ